MKFGQVSARQRPLKRTWFLLCQSFEETLLRQTSRRMPWQGDTNNMIDRFDVRAHLDYIPMYTPPLLNPM
ncbi:clk4-associating serine arginine rich protein [Limosa lapponica baueri]|uniref:Clk4-associating serine arginine rich protein n=1 Tax=Limosa lapponica baueri TaxID=1758121 RepID=A0A2I0T3H6_LIMLA|nr:clk4-associating serine arginine rich protein [Limosa lapponica baueri]